ncbi:hypothetical protein RYX36_005656 [Vicia faba]
MSRAPIFVSDLEIGKQVWKMAVGVHDLWTDKEINGSLHVELVIQDTKACDNQLKRLFNSATTLCKTPIHNMPPHKFNFNPVSDFLGGSYKHDQLYGILHEVIRKQIAGNNKKACANIALSDYHGNIIDLELWDAFASKLSAYLNSNNNVTPTIIVLTHGWCKSRMIASKLRATMGEIQPTELSMYETSSTNTPSKRDVDAIRFDETYPIKFLTP